MKVVLAWLLMAGVWAGSLAGLLPHLSDEVYPCAQIEECSNLALSHCTDCSTHDHACAEEGDGGSHAATHHHHHHQAHVCCSGISVLYVEAHPGAGISSINEVRTRLLVENMVAPECPVFELDKPPLV